MFIDYVYCYILLLQLAVVIESVCLRTLHNTYFPNALSLLKCYIDYALKQVLILSEHFSFHYLNSQNKNQYLAVILYILFLSFVILTRKSMEILKSRESHNTKSHLKNKLMFKKNFMINLRSLSLSCYFPSNLVICSSHSLLVHKSEPKHISLQ